MTALTVVHKIAAPLEVIPADLGLKAQNVTVAIQQLKITDAETYQAGNRLLTEAHRMGKELEKIEASLIKPINDLKSNIKDVMKGVTDPLAAAKRSMQASVTAYDAAERAKAAQAKAEADEKARIDREAAEKERARLQAIADEEHRQKVAAAQQLADEEAAEKAALLGRTVEPAPAYVAPAPKVELPKPAQACPAPAYVAPVLPKAAAQIVKVPVMNVTDPAALAAFLFAQGRGDLVEFKLREVKAMLDAGVPVAGVAMEMREQTRMAGR